MTNASCAEIEPMRGAAGLRWEQATANNNQRIARSTNPDDLSMNGQKDVCCH